MVTASDAQHTYQGVNPGDAVKVAEFDDYYDLDYILQIYLIVQSQSLGCIQIATPPKKGGIDEVVLLWDTGEAGKNVSIRQCRQHEAYDSSR